MPIEKEKYKCSCCGKNKIETEFYMSYSSLYKAIGRLPLCKSCVEKLYDSKLEIYNNIQKAVKEVCNMLDIHFDITLFEAAEQQAKIKSSNVMSIYMQKINSLKQNKGKTFDYIAVENARNNLGEISKKVSCNDFEITKDIIIKWGDKYSIEEYIRLEDFYNKMKDMNAIETPQEEAYLKKLAILSVKMDNELGNNNYSEAKQLGDLFSKYMADSKFRAMDKTDADKTGGIRNFSTIYQEVESDDFIPPWENYAKILKVGQDIVDKTIMHIENFTLRLNKAERMTEPPIDTPKVDKEV